MQGTNDNRTPKTSSLRPGHVRSVAIAATIVGVVVLPIAAANANPLHSDNAKQPSVTGTPATGSPATATALLPQYCGTTETGFGGQVTAQVCVNDSDGTVTGTVFVANSSAKPLTTGITLSSADNSSANITCTVAAHDANGECTTGPLTITADTGAFQAIAETVPVNAPVADGVLRADSGEVSPAAGSAAGTSASPSASTSGESSPAAGTATTPTTSASADASSSAS